VGDGDGVFFCSSSLIWRVIATAGRLELEEFALLCFCFLLFHPSLLWYGYAKAFYVVFLAVRDG
jgi:hypothetical protein